MHTSTGTTEDEDDSDLGAIEGGPLLRVRLLRLRRFFLGGWGLEMELFCHLIEDGHRRSLFGSSRDDAVRGARGFSERRED